MASSVMSRPGAAQPPLPLCAYATVITRVHCEAVTMIHVDCKKTPTFARKHQAVPILYLVILL